MGFSMGKVDIYTFDIRRWPTEKGNTMIKKVKQDLLINDIYLNQADTVRHIVGRALLIHGLYTSKGISKFSLFKAIDGKPELYEEMKLHFNISHSGDWVVCAIGDDPLGIDIEEIKKVDLDFAVSILNHDELSYIYKFDIEQKDSRFYEIWTFKESVSKCLGRGLLMSLKSIPFDIEHKGCTEIDGIKFYNKRFCYDNNYYMSLIQRRAITEVNIIKSEYWDIVISVKALNNLNVGNISITNNQKQKQETRYEKSRGK